MAYKLALSARAERDIDDFLDWLGGYSPETAVKYEADLYSAMQRHVLERPHTWAYFYLLGQPYRGYLYTVSRRTSYWLIYSVSEEDRTVKVARFWNSARDPDKFSM